MANSHNTIGTTAMLPADQPHSGRTAPIPAVVPISNEDQNSKTHLLWNSSTAVYQSVQPPCGRTAHNTPVVPITLTALIDFTKNAWTAQRHGPTTQTKLDWPKPLSITHHSHGDTTTWSLNLPLDENIDKLRKSFKKSLSLKKPTWSKEWNEANDHVDRKNARATTERANLSPKL